MNSCHFSGRLTKDAEVQYTPSGVGITRYTVAVNSGYGDNKRADFFDCFQFKAENTAPYLTKGKPVTIRAQYQLRVWDDKNTGQKRSKPEFLVQEMEFQQGDGKQQPGQQMQHQNPQQIQPQNTPQQMQPQNPQQMQPQNTPQQMQPQNTPQQGFNAAFGGNDPFNNDIPF